MIGEFERRIAEMPTDQVRVTLDAMALALDESKTLDSTMWFTDRVISCQRELGRRNNAVSAPIAPSRAGST